MKKILKRLLVLQEKSNKKLGRGVGKAYRLNPFNPLSYATIVIGIVVGIVMFGIVGIWKEIELVNPFKWR